MLFAVRYGVYHKSFVQMTPSLVRIHTVDKVLMVLVVAFALVLVFSELFHTYLSHDRYKVIELFRANLV